MGVRLFYSIVVNMYNNVIKYVLIKTIQTVNKNLIKLRQKRCDISLGHRPLDMGGGGGGGGGGEGKGHVNFP